MKQWRDCAVRFVISFWGMYLFGYRIAVNYTVEIANQI